MNAFFTYYDISFYIVDLWFVGLQCLLYADHDINNSIESYYGRSNKWLNDLIKKIERKKNELIDVASCDLFCHHLHLHGLE